MQINMETLRKKLNKYLFKYYKKRKFLNKHKRIKKQTVHLKKIFETPLQIKDKFH